MPKVKVKPDTYKILARAVEKGIDYGWNRAHKHTDNPGEDTIKNEMDNAIMPAFIVNNILKMSV